MAELPIVAGYLIDQHRRAGRCEAIAERGRDAALARTTKKRGAAGRAVGGCRGLAGNA